MKDNQTIAAIATPIGRGGIGIIRISGDAAGFCAEKILGRIPKPRYAEYLPFKDKDGKILDHGIALYFPKPNSYTGEDVLEIQAHGGPVVLDLLLKEILETNNVRAAEPGEFTERAFLNDKIDLTQAEAVCDLIEASSEQAVRSASNSLQGEFSNVINRLKNKLIDIRTYIEASIDFPDEDGVDYISEGGISEKICELLKETDNVKKAAINGTAIRDGMKIVIAGRPNAGKSSILNRLSGQDTAIVTDVAGTTRDILREQIFIDGMPLHIIDTAGLRDTDDKVEQIGVKRAWQEITEADLVLLVMDITLKEHENRDIYDGITAKLPSGIPVCIILNKSDLNSSPYRETFNNEKVIRLSAKTGEGIDELRQYLKETMGYSSCTEGSFIARRRHLEALDRTCNYIKSALEQIRTYKAGELAAEDLRYAQNCLNEITGEFTSDDLLSKIFGSFCIGK
jgi:tRNA modification GTPase